MSLSKYNHATSGRVLVNTTSRTVLAAGFAENLLILQNDSAVDYYLNFAGAAAEVHKGFVLKAGVNWEATQEFGDLPVGLITVIAATDAGGVQATGTLTFTGAAVNGNTVTIGDDVYEFRTSGGVTSPGRIKVDVSGGATAPAAVTALVAVITASGTEPFTAADGAGDTVVLTAIYTGVDVTATTETCTNASWGATTTGSGVNGVNYLLVSYK